MGLTVVGHRAGVTRHRNRHVGSRLDLEVAIHIGHLVVALILVAARGNGVVTDRLSLRTIDRVGNLVVVERSIYRCCELCRIIGAVIFPSIVRRHRHWLLGNLERPPLHRDVVVRVALRRRVHREGISSHVLALSTRHRVGRVNAVLRLARHRGGKLGIGGAIHLRIIVGLDGDGFRVDLQPTVRHTGERRGDVGIVIAELADSETHRVGSRIGLGQSRCVTRADHFARIEQRGRARGRGSKTGDRFRISVVSVLACRTRDRNVHRGLVDGEITLVDCHRIVVVRRVIGRQHFDIRACVVHRRICSAVCNCAQITGINQIRDRSRKRRVCRTVGLAGIIHRNGHFLGVDGEIALVHDDGIVVVRRVIGRQHSIVCAGIVPFSPYVLLLLLTVIVTCLRFIVSVPFSVVTK